MILASIPIDSDPQKKYGKENSNRESIEFPISKARTWRNNSNAECSELKASSPC
jgi:hypothetical protein